MSYAGQYGAYPPPPPPQTYGYPPPPAYGPPPVAPGYYPPQAPVYSGAQAGVPPHQYEEPVKPAYSQPAPYQQPYQTAVPVQPTVMSGGDKADDVPSGAPGSAYADMMARRVRHGFIQKVYGILTLQLLLTFGIVCIFSFVGSVKAAVQASPGILWAAFGVSFALLIIMACCPGVTQRSPTSYICLFTFTLAEGYLVGAIASYYSPNAVSMAMGSTVVITLALTLFACQTRIDFTAWAGCLFVILLAFTIFAIVAGAVRSNVLHYAIAAIGVCIFGCFLVFDTQMVIGRPGAAMKYDIDEAVVAALNIYIDVIQMFLYLLRLFGRD